MEKVTQSRDSDIVGVLAFKESVNEHLRIIREHIRNAYMLLITVIILAASRPSGDPITSKHSHSSPPGRQRVSGEEKGRQQSALTFAIIPIILPLYIELNMVLRCDGMRPRMRDGKRSNQEVYTRQPLDTTRFLTSSFWTVRRRLRLKVLLIPSEEVLYHRHDVPRVLCHTLESLGDRCHSPQQEPTVQVDVR